MRNNENVAAQGAGRTRMRSDTCVYACPWPHGVTVDGADSMTGACTSIAFDVLRTVKGDYGSSG